MTTAPNTPSNLPRTLRRESARRTESLIASCRIPGVISGTTEIGRPQIVAPDSGSEFPGATTPVSATTTVAIMLGRFTPSRLLGALFVAAIVASTLGCSSGDQSSTLDSDPATMQPAAAQAMGEVQSVRFALERTGAPVYIDTTSTLALDRLEGRFQIPANADAILDITVLGNLQTQIGAVALDGETWMSNPVTGAFEALPASVGVDPSKFFDPAGAWEPLIANATNVEFVEEVVRDGRTLYEYTGVGQADDVARVTSNLVTGQDVEFTMWVDPDTALLAGLDFETTLGDSTSQWSVVLSDYGSEFTITDPTQ